MDCSTPGLSVLHHLPEFAQVHVHCISDAVEPSHLLTPSSPSALNLSQHHEGNKTKQNKNLPMELLIQSQGASYFHTGLPKKFTKFARLEQNERNFAFKI